MTENKIGIESLYIPKEVMALLQNGGINTPSKWKGYFSKTPILFKAPLNYRFSW